MISVLLLCPLAAMGRQDSIPLSEVEVVAPAFIRSVGATTEMQTLSRTDLRSLGIDNVADAVKRLAGVSVKDYGGIGGMKTVSIHSLGAHHTALVYDGIVVSNIQAGQTDIGRYDTGNLESLTLCVGDEDNLMMSATQYVAAGSLSLVTARPKFSDERQQSVRAGVHAGMFGLLSPNVTYARRLGRGTTASLYGKYMRADGNYPYTLHNGTLRTREKRSNGDINAWRAEVNLYHNFADSSRLEVKTNYFYSRRGLPGVVILYAGPSDERLTDEDFFTQAIYHRQLCKAVQLDTRVKYAHARSCYQDWGMEYTRGEQTDINRQDECFASATLGWELLPQLALAVAGDLSYNKLKNNVYVNTNYDVPRPSRLTAVTAAAMRWRWGRLKMRSALAYTLACEHVEVGEAPADKKRFTPSVSLNYRLLPHRQLYVRAMWKHVFRVPTFNNLYYRRLGNIHLRPELAREYSLGLTWNMPCARHMPLKYLTMTLDGYYHDVRDKIVAFPGMYVWRMSNYGKVEIAGVDMTFGCRADIAPGWEVKVGASATWQRAVDKTDRSALSYNNMLPYTPRRSGAGAVVLSTPVFNIGYAVVMQGTRYSMGHNIAEYRMARFWHHDISISRSFTLGKCVLHAMGKVSNLTNAQYEIIQYYPMPGRQLSASVSVEF